MAIKITMHQTPDEGMQTCAYVKLESLSFRAPAHTEIVVAVYASENARRNGAIANHCYTIVLDKALPKGNIYKWAYAQIKAHEYVAKEKKSKVSDDLED